MDLLRQELSISVDEPEKLASMDWHMIDTIVPKWGFPKMMLPNNHRFSY